MTIYVVLDCLINKQLERPTKSIPTNRTTNPNTHHTHHEVDIGIWWTTPRPCWHKCQHFHAWVSLGFSLFLQASIVTFQYLCGSSLGDRENYVWSLNVLCILIQDNLSLHIINYQAQYNKWILSRLSSAVKNSGENINKWSVVC